MTGTGVAAAVVLLGAAAALSPRSQVPATRGAIWPQPRSLLHSESFLLLDPETFQFNTIGYTCDILYNAYTRYIKVIKNDAKGNLPEFYKKNDILDDDREAKVLALNPNFTGNLTCLKVKLNNHCENFPHLQMNESYELNIDSGEAIGSLLEADSIWGILRGLETFVQLTYKSKNSNQLIIQKSHVVDAPRFKHRGLMLDTSRHYLPKGIILKMLSAMEANKLNVFHWHMVDDQSFPYQSSAFPSLSEKGAYHPHAYIYSFDEIKEIIQYARLRGIRVLPEFDTPGHTLSWGQGIPNLLTKCYKDDKPSGEFGPIDPSCEENYKFIGKLFEEVTNLFPENYLHLGGDEVDFTCWKSNPDINQFMKEKGISDDYAKLEDYYIQKIIEITEKLDAKALVWQEVFQHGVSISNETVVHIWTGSQEKLLEDVTSSGHFAILSTCWYLDHFSFDLYGGGGDWIKFYNCEPLSFDGSDEQKKLVLGGEACMWGEFVDHTNIIPRVWPRASAAAEKLWSSKDVDDTDEAAHRLEEHVCRMRRRGIDAQPPNGPGACL